MPHIPSRRSAVDFEEIGSSASPLFRAFFALYEAAFPLEDEREGVEAFDAILALNRDRDAQVRYGPYREVVSVLRDPDDGSVLGGHVFGIASGRVHEAAQIIASVQGIYSFVRPDMRGRIPMRALIDYCRREAIATVGSEHDPLTAAGRLPILMEVNNPLRMTPDEIALDRRLSGVDPFRRYVFWMGVGFAPLAVDYVQPRLRADADPIRYLDLFCSSDLSGALPTTVLLQHLRAFLSLSVLKDGNADDDADFAAIGRLLAERPTVDFVARSDPRIAEIVARARAAREEAHRAP